MSGASANAVVNAPVVTVRAPTAGDLTLNTNSLGSRVREGEELASVLDPLVDSVRLNDLRMETTFAEAEIARLTADLAAVEAMRDSLDDRTEIFRAGRLEELTVRLEHARARLAILDGEPVEREGDAEDTGASADISPQRTRDDRLAIERAREDVEVLEIALETAKKGVFLGDGYNDSPNAEQRATELETRITDLQNALAQAITRFEAVSTRTERAYLRFNNLTGGAIRSPVNGIYWEVLQAGGVNVQRGDPILRLVDCDASFVTLSVTERLFNTLSIGDEASFRMGGKGRVFEATVARLAGSGAETIYRNLAVAPTQRHLERYDVALLVPGLTADADRGCAIGRTGRAFFDGRPLDWFRTLLD
ncbi:HlyD family efflux transporter periplasmic adaptor subunit [Sulfitobacter sp. HNIBRBA3233]|uniref:HlyD family secretion protein n=1 Tax=Sulfitobacter marinivivus TaxID=3158558 RepID=UPI0032DE3DD6